MASLKQIFVSSVFGYIKSSWASISFLDYTLTETFFLGGEP